MYPGIFSTTKFIVIISFSVNPNADRESGREMQDCHDSRFHEFVPVI